MVELINAKKHRDEKNEGKSRVCARRAVGFAISAYYAENSLRVGEMNAMSLIRSLRNEPGLPGHVEQALDALVMRVSPDHDLPDEVDLISSAQVVFDHLFPGLSQLDQTE